MSWYALKDHASMTNPAHISPGPGETIRKYTAEEQKAAARKARENAQLPKEDRRS
jgi:hypothetical protein